MKIGMKSNYVENVLEKIYKNLTLFLYQAKEWKNRCWKYERTLVKNQV